MAERAGGRLTQEMTLLTAEDHPGRLEVTEDPGITGRPGPLPLAILPRKNSQFSGILYPSRGWLRTFRQLLGTGPGQLEVQT